MYFSHLHGVLFARHGNGSGRGSHHDDRRRAFLPRDHIVELRHEEKLVRAPHCVPANLGDAHPVTIARNGTQRLGHGYIVTPVLLYAPDVTLLAKAGDVRPAVVILLLFIFGGRGQD